MAVETIKNEDGTVTLKEIVKVKFKDEDNNYFYKKYPSADIKILKSASVENIDEEEKENLKELQKLEELEMQDSKNKTKDDI